MALDRQQAIAWTNFLKFHKASLDFNELNSRTQQELIFDASSMKIAEQ